MSERPGRNDPCPCGSGRKYKHCHAESDRAAADAPQLRLLANAPPVQRDRMLQLPPPSQLNRAWELDLVPVPAMLADDPAARPAALLVMAPPFMLACEFVDRPSAEPDELAVLLARHVLAAQERAGVAPTHVAIRHLSLVEPLSRLLAEHGIALVPADELPSVADALQGLLAHVFGGIVPLHLLRSQPETWAGWGMPADLTARLFRAAAAFHRAAPWTVPARETAIMVTRPGGDPWAAVILGAAGEQTGLALYHEIADLEWMYMSHSATESSAMFDDLEDVVVSLLFNTRGELPKRMRAEIQREGWEIAGPNAYPTLTVLNAPGGGIRQRYFEDLIAALESVPRFVAQHVAVLAGNEEAYEGVAWRDPETGTTCTLAFDEGLFDEFSPPSMLHPAGSSGPGATPLATLDDESTPRSVNRTLARFRAWLRKPRSGKPPSEATVRSHADMARLFVELCAYSGRKPVTGVSEFELRSFLYDWYPRKVADSLAGARRMLVTLRRFFAFLEDREGVVCPWAWPILDDVETFELRWESFPGGFFWDEAVQDWQAPYVRDLASRVLLPVSDAQGGIAWGSTMGMAEYALNREAHRLWIAWRDEAIAGGITAPGEVLAVVAERQRVWAQTPNANCGGLTPHVAIEQERKQMRAGDKPAPRKRAPRKPTPRKPTPRSTGP